MPRHVSSDHQAKRLSPKRVREKLQQHPELASRLFSLFSWLPEPDPAICSLYFVDGLTQVQISRLIGIGQPEVSGRLHSCIKLLRFLEKRNTSNPIQLRNDLSELMPPRLVMAAHCLYLNISPSRAADLLKVSESTARNLRKEIVAHLEKWAALPGRGPYDLAELTSLGLIDTNGAVLAENEVARGRELACSYLEDFQRAGEVSERLVRPFRKNEAHRSNALIEGEPIIERSAR